MRGDNQSLELVFRLTTVAASQGGGVRQGPSSCNGTLRVHLRLVLKIDVCALSCRCWGVRGHL